MELEQIYNLLTLIWTTAAFEGSGMYQCCVTFGLMPLLPKCYARIDMKLEIPMSEAAFPEMRMGVRMNFPKTAAILKSIYYHWRNSTRAIPVPRKGWTWVSRPGYLQSFIANTKLHERIPYQRGCKRELQALDQGVMQTEH